MTHDPERGGNPRLIVAVGGSAQVDLGEVPSAREFPLLGELTAVGSAPDSDVLLAGLAERHAEIVHDDSDEYVFLSNSGALSHINGEPIARRPLRTGDRLEIGPWTLSFFREEYADHSRPYGGRQGGEGAVQRPQPARSEVSNAKDPTPEDLRTVRLDEAPESWL